MKNKNSALFMALLFAAPLAFTACSSSGNTASEDATTSEEVTTEGEPMDHSQHEMGSGEMSGMMGHMQENMQEMKSMELTGDPDYDFATIMAKHHQGAIKMAEEELASGTDEQLKQMAQKSIASNREEIEKLENFADNHKPTPGDTAASRKMMQAMMDTMGTMDHQGMMAGGADQSFAQMMSHHHQSGIDMAKVYLQQGKSEELKSIAQKTINEQQKEKQELDAWLAQNKQ